MRLYSVIIPVYNRPQEVLELLDSLTRQTYTRFEVLVIEDGSTDDCKEIVERFRDRLDVQYFFKPNSGQGFTRNYGFDRAGGDYLIVFDSDCLIPPHYFAKVEARLAREPLDAYGGPDKVHASFTPLQKAISYSMTSPFTTGGIRGNKKHAGTFHPRSFNMGISREVYQKTGGYLITRKGEDIEFSIRILSRGFKSGLIPEAFVYHKRRTDMRQFYKQLHFFGTARVNVRRFFPSELKLIHTFPAAFVLALAVWASTVAWSPLLFQIGSGFLLLFALLNFFHSLYLNKSPGVAALSVATSFIQLIAYGMGMISEAFKKTELQKLNSIF